MSASAPPPPTAREIAERLADPFDPRFLKLKPQCVGKDKATALAVVYYDARLVMDRLDAVLGVDGWQDDYEVLADGSVVCRLRLRIGGEWVTRTDVGGQSEQPDGGDRLKAAFSEALKRAAVKFGVGRYVYAIPAQWLAYDERRRQITGLPRLREEFLPAAMRKALPPAAGQPSGDRPKALPVQGGADRSGPPVDEAELASQDLVWKAHTLISSTRRTWRDCVAWAKFQPPVAFEEPADDSEVLALCEWLPAWVAEKIAAGIEASVKRQALAAAHGK